MGFLGVIIPRHQDAPEPTQTRSAQTRPQLCTQWSNVSLRGQCQQGTSQVDKGIRNSTPHTPKHSRRNVTSCHFHGASERTTKHVKRQSVSLHFTDSPKEKQKSSPLRKRGMSPGLIVSDRPSLTLVSVHRSRWSFHSQLVPLPKKFLDNMLAPVLPIPETKKTHDWSVE